MFEIIIIKYGPAKKREREREREREKRSAVLKRNLWKANIRQKKVGDRLDD